MSKRDSEVSRRDFLRGSLVGGAALAAGLPAWFADDARAQELALTPPPRRRTIGPNDTITFGVIGPGGSKGGFRQGLNVTRAASRQPGCKVVAVCDVDAVHLQGAANAFGPGTQKYTDFRELLARPDIDAVVIGAPDHWHGVMAVLAMRAGKDVYCEKPLTLTIDEGKKIVQTARETGAVFQTGSQQRSDARFRLACELVRNNHIGKVKRVEARIPGARAGGPFAPQLVPRGFDWDLWLGPAPLASFVKERTHGNFRYWYEYAGGMVTDWGAHHLDITQWGLGADGSGPLAVSAVGTLPEQAKNPHAYNVHTGFEITYQYPNDVSVVCTNKGENGVRFEGENNQWIFVSRGKIEASDPKLLDEPLSESATRLYVSPNHMANFVECIRTRKTPICDAVVGHRSVSVCHLGNISLRLGNKALQWDPLDERFVGAGSGEANEMLSRPMRGPWTV